MKIKPANDIRMGDSGEPTSVEVKRRTPPEWFKKYFWQGQALAEGLEVKQDADLTHPSCGRRTLARYRRPIGILLPVTLIFFLYWSAFISYGRWHLFKEHYLMAVTMVFGALVAGMTSEGGGAVAFPVMTLAMGITPSVARDFSMMIQAVGMTSSAFAILFQRIQVEWNALVYCCIGGSIGTIVGLHFIDPYLTPRQKKIIFVSVWFSFAVSLYLLNRARKRRTFSRIADLVLWKSVSLLLAGFVGGAFTSLVGSGVDICSFSVLTLLFRVSEKVATPTSVILMSVISLVGSYWRLVVMRTVAVETWHNFVVCVPVVCVFAPFGATLSSHFHRLVLATIIYVIDVFALVSAYVIVPMTTGLAVLSVVIVVVGSVFFFGITKIGERLIATVPDENHTNDDAVKISSIEVTKF